MSSQDPDREITRALRLRGDPPSVVRLSKRTLVVLAGGASFAIAGVTGWSLVNHRRGEPATPAEPVGPGAPPQAVAELPKDYAALPPGVAKLGPPLPGDLGKPILDGAATSASTPVADRTVQPAKLDAQQARASRLSASLSGVRDAKGGEAAIEAAAPPRPEKVAATRLRLSAGTAIRAALITGIRSDIPGPVTAQVTEDVFDSATGLSRLIPQGARLVGAYQGRPAFGQDRLAVAWSTLILPDGRSIDLEQAPAADPQGFVGLSDGVDRHWRRLVGASVLSTLLGMGAELGTSERENRLIEALRGGAASTASQAGQQLVGKSLDVPPTLTIRPGFGFRVILTKDLELEPVA